MSDTLMFLGILFGIIFGVVFGAFGLAVWVESSSCYAKWPDRNPSWGVFTGCIIDTQEGRIPEKNFRVL